MLLLNIKLVLETCASIFFVLSHEGYVWMEEVTFFNSHAFDVSCRREFEKVSFASSGIIPSQSCICVPSDMRCYMLDRCGIESGS